MKKDGSVLEGDLVRSSSLTITLKAPWLIFFAHQCSTLVHLLSLVPSRDGDGGGVWGRHVL